MMEVDSIFESWHYLIIPLISVVLIIFIFKPAKKNTSPPLCAGWIPWIGCGLEMGKHPLTFIKDKADELGPVFTLYAAGKRLTFLFDPDDHHLFMNSSDLNFTQGVADSVHHAASIDKASFVKDHTMVHDLIKGKLSPGNLHDTHDVLYNEFDEQFLHLGESDKDDLNEVCRRVMYAVVMDTLFGKNILPTEKQAAFNKIKDHFVLFDADFEYGSQMPEFLFRRILCAMETIYTVNTFGTPGNRILEAIIAIRHLLTIIQPWAQSKHWLLSLFNTVVPKIKHSEAGSKTLLQSVLTSVDSRFGANYSLLLLWASLANAIPIAFWTMCFILSDSEVKDRVTAEILSSLGQHVEGKSSSFTEENLQKIPYLKHCILEAIRLRSPGVITRMAVKDLSVKDFVIPKGDMVMISPYWSHRNTDLFPDPEKFDPGRWKDVSLEKSQYLDGFVAFGGGRYQCPGRWFALLELQMFIAMFLQRYEVRLLDQIPNPSPLHVVGTQQPVSRCHVEYRKRTIPL